ncbi:hypothetical protein [Shinella sp.]|uniref:hypothetical protein n=1 Tax=Shinella sp. TaxID=1870904 RepID=UPI0029A8BACD|nr:hypothetical protein [Shinella sp.]MDX3977021.1 hypothetical protein [Shinella sp.]
MAKTIEDLFRRWREAERLASRPITDEVAERHLAEGQALQAQIVGSVPGTARELAIILLVGTDRWASHVEPKLRTLVVTLAEEREQ